MEFTHEFKSLVNVGDKKAMHSKSENSFVVATIL